MNDPSEYKPRFSFEITEDQKIRADRVLDVYGIRKSVFSIILDDVLDMIEEHGNIVIGILLDGAAKPKEIVPVLAKAEKRAK